MEGSTAIVAFEHPQPLALPAPVASNPIVSEDVFTSSVQADAKPAVETTKAAENAAAGSGGGFALPDPAKDVNYTHKDEPNFAIPGSGEGATETTANKPLTRKDIDLKTKFVLRLGEFGVSNACAWLAGEMENDLFKFTDEDKEILAEALEPYIEQHGHKITPGLNLTFALMAVVVPKGKLALQMKKYKKENEQLRAAMSPQQAAVFAAASPGKERSITNHEIDENGFYIRNANGKHIKQGERTEKAHLKDIVKLIEKNGWPVVQQHFKLADDYREQNLIEIN